MFCKCHFSFSPPSPVPRKGHSQKGTFPPAAAAPRRASMATGIHTQCSASPQALHSRWRCQRGVGTAGKAQGSCCEHCAQWHSSWNCQRYWNRGEGDWHLKVLPPLDTQLQEVITESGLWLDFKKNKLLFWWQTESMSLWDVYLGISSADSVLHTS